ncbi:hypothetical protein BGW80DRAFT_1405908 [Lactifluus volemus]|nr:hypothetical protein BGW80DRAFT_1405908 [Lactifluus volemus]
MNARSNDGSTPLHQASQRRWTGGALEGKFAVACLLLEHGADIRAVDNSGRTAFHVADQDHEEMIKLLSEHASPHPHLTSCTVPSQPCYDKADSRSTRRRVRLLYATVYRCQCAPSSSDRNPMSLPIAFCIATKLYMFGISHPWPC